MYPSVSSSPHGLSSFPAIFIPTKRSGAFYRPESQDTTAYGESLDEHNKRIRYRGPSASASAWRQQHLLPVHLRLHHSQGEVATTLGDGLAARPTMNLGAAPASSSPRYPSLDPPSPTPEFWPTTAPSSSTAFDTSAPQVCPPASSSCLQPQPPASEKLQTLLSSSSSSSSPPPASSSSSPSLSIPLSARETGVSAKRNPKPKRQMPHKVHRTDMGWRPLPSPPPSPPPDPRTGRKILLPADFPTKEDAEICARYYIGAEQVEVAIPRARIRRRPRRRRGVGVARQEEGEGEGLREGHAETGGEEDGQEDAEGQVREDQAEDDTLMSRGEGPSRILAKRRSEEEAEALAPTKVPRQHWLVRAGFARSNSIAVSFSAAINPLRVFESPGTTLQYKLTQCSTSNCASLSRFRFRLQHNLSADVHPTRANKVSLEAARHAPSQASRNCRSHRGDGRADLHLPALEPGKGALAALPPRAPLPRAAHGVEEEPGAKGKAPFAGKGRVGVVRGFCQGVE